MGEKLFIGLDFGTDSVRALLVSASGVELAHSVCPYPRWSAGKYCDPTAGMFRQHPLDYLESMEQVLKSVLKECDPAQVLGIGVDTTGSTPCAVDSDGVPLALTPGFEDDPDAMFILWKDHTAIAEAEKITDAAKNRHTDYTMYSGGSYSCEWFWSKALHVLQNNTKVRAKAHLFTEHCDWITALLAGAPVKAGRCTAGHKAMWHSSWGGLPPEDFFAAVSPLLTDLRQRLYTDTFTADIPVGKLSPEWQQKLGLSPHVVISGGMLDAHAGAVGAGIQPGTLVRIMGTSSCDILVTPGIETTLPKLDRPSGDARKAPPAERFRELPLRVAPSTLLPDLLSESSVGVSRRLLAVPSIERCIPGICGQVEGSVLPGFTGLEAGQAAFGDVFGWFRNLLSYSGTPVSIARLEKEAAELDSGNISALDWFNGRRTPYANANLRGAISGLDLGSTAPMIFRALAESAVFGSRAIFDRFIDEGIEIKEIKALGGIAKKSPFIMQMSADVLNRPIQAVRSEQACALGSAIFAAAASGAFPDTAAAVSAMASPVEKIYTPNPAKAEVYRQKYELYLRRGKFEEQLL